LSSFLKGDLSAFGVLASVFRKYRGKKANGHFPLLCVVAICGFGPHTGDTYSMMMNKEGKGVT